LEIDKVYYKYVKSYSVLYSIILRLRGIFIIKCILKKEKFLNKKFQKWLIQNSIINKEFEQCYLAYRAVRDNKDTKNIRVKISVAERLLSILTRETNLIKEKLYGKQKEKITKRH